MQRSICKDFADGFGWEVCETFEDVGGSSESLDPTEAKHVGKIFELAVSGKRPQEIADYANGRKRQTRRDGAMWTARQVLKMLSNPTYVGMIHHGPGRLPGQHEAIVDHAIFEQVRTVIASRRSRKADYAPAKFLFPLRRLLKCGRCHRAMTPCMNQRKYFREYFYRCRSRAGGKPPCRNVSLRAFEIEDFISSIFEQSEEEHESSANTPLEAIRSSWRKLNMRTQTNLLATIIKEVIFDPDAGSIVVTLVDDASEQIMSAKSHGCSTRYPPGVNTR